MTPKEIAAELSRMTGKEFKEPGNPAPSSYDTGKTDAKFSCVTSQSGLMDLFPVVDTLPKGAAALVQLHHNKAFAIAPEVFAGDARAVLAKLDAAITERKGGKAPVARVDEAVKLPVFEPSIPLDPAFGLC
jgi:hypothetical protein